MSFPRNIKLVLGVTILPLIGVGVIATALFLQNRLSTNTQATPDHILSISPRNINIEAKKNFDVRIFFTSETGIRQTKIVLKFDKNYLKVVGDPRPNPLLGKVVSLTTAAQANESGEITVHTKLPNDKPTFKDNYVYYVTFQGKVPTPGATDISIDNTQSFIKIANQNILDTTTIRTGSYVITAAGATPVPVCDQVTATPNTGTAPLTVQGNIRAIPANATTPITEYIFNFAGSEQSGTNNKASYTYTTPGIYQIVAKVKDSNGTISETCATTVEVVDPTNLVHNACVNNACAEVPGAGTDSCTEIGATCVETGQVHWECQNNACTQVQGAGTNFAGCTTIGQTCTTDRPSTDGDPEIVDQNHFTCVNNACIRVSGAGQNTGGCTAAGQTCISENQSAVCTTPGDRACFDCNSDNAINMLDYSCFSAKFDR